MTDADLCRHFYDLGLDLLSQGRKKEALARFLAAAGADSTNAGPAIRAIDLLIELDRPKEAMALGCDLFSRFQDDGLEIILSCPLPAIPATDDDARSALAYFERRLNQLSARRDLSVDHPHLVQPKGHFLLAYHDRPVRALREAMARLMLKAHPALALSPSLAPAKADAKRPVRLGVACALLAAHTVGLITIPLLEALAELGVELHLFLTNENEDGDLARLKTKAASCALLPPDLARAKSAIAAAGLDALLYPEIGMDPFVYCLAFARLAPLQMMMWGHPMTSGLSTIDRFVTSRLIEPEGYRDHYTETPLLLDAMPIVAADHFLADPPGRSALGLPLDKRLYVCPQSLFKLSPTFDRALGRILDGDPDGLLVLLDGQKPEWKERLSERLAASLGSHMNRVVFLPRLDRISFIGLLAAADVLLDPFGFSGGNTSAEALANGTPIVTLPGRTMAGRVTLGFLRQMGIEDTVAQDADSYVRLALQTAREKSGHHPNLMRSKHKLFGRKDAARQLAEFLSNPLG